MKQNAFKLVGQENYKRIQDHKEEQELFLTQGSEGLEIEKHKPAWHEEKESFLTLTTSTPFCAFLMSLLSSGLSSSSSSNKLSTFLAWLFTSFPRAGGDVANRSELPAGSEDTTAKGSTKEEKKK